VKPNDPKRLAKAVIELLSDEERRRQLGKKARESVSEFDWKDVVERELEAIIDLWKGLERSC
jgi:glycosyltransferase involved in cell wall biosynthesis